MKQLILIFLLSIVCVLPATSQTYFQGQVDGRSTIVVQDLKTGTENIIYTNKEVVVPLQSEHDYFISVTTKKSIKQFVVKRSSDTGHLDDGFFNISNAPPVTIIRGIDDPFEDFYRQQKTIYNSNTNLTFAAGDPIDPGL